MGIARDTYAARIERLRESMGAASVEAVWVEPRWGSPISRV